MIPVDLNITSIAKTDEGEDKVEFFTVGRFEITEDGYAISYDENEGIGYENCTVSIEKNIKHHSIYSTPFGDFTMGVNTYDVQNTLTENGGRLWFKYSIDINSDFVSENEMDITVTLPGNSVAQHAMSP